MRTNFAAEAVDMLNDFENHQLEKRLAKARHDASRVREESVPFTHATRVIPHHHRNASFLIVA